MAAKKKAEAKTKSFRVGDSGVLVKVTPGNILIEPVDAEKKTSTGIYLPDSTEKKTLKGKVLGVGGAQVTDSGVERTSPVKVGQIVIYKKWGGSEVQIGSKEYLFAKFEDILAVEE